MSVYADDMRDLAVKLGAIEIDRRCVAELIRQKRAALRKGLP